MQVIFDFTHDASLRMYIHMFSACDAHKVEKKLFLHSEVDTVWSDMLDEWRKEGYYSFYRKEELVGHATTITVVTFHEVHNAREFIHKLNTYMYGSEADLVGAITMVSYNNL